VPVAALVGVLVLILVLIAPLLALGAAASFDVLVAALTVLLCLPR
jgi:hypothetical protein